MTVNEYWLSPDLSITTIYSKAFIIVLDYTRIYFPFRPIVYTYYLLLKFSASAAINKQSFSGVSFVHPLPVL